MSKYIHFGWCIKYISCYLAKGKQYLIYVYELALLTFIFQLPN